MLGTADVAHLQVSLPEGTNTQQTGWFLSNGRSKKKQKKKLRNTQHTLGSGDVAHLQPSYQNGVFPAPGLVSAPLVAADAHEGGQVAVVGTAGVEDSEQVYLNHWPACYA